MPGSSACRADANAELPGWQYGNALFTNHNIASRLQFIQDHRHELRRIRGAGTDFSQCAIRPQQPDQGEHALCRQAQTGV